MECKNCGAEVPEGARFCPTCGIPADTTDQTAQVAGSPAAAEGSPTPQAPRGQPPQAAGQPPPPPGQPPPPPGPPGPTPQGQPPYMSPPPSRYQPPPPGVQPPGQQMYPPPPGMPGYPPAGVYIRNNPLCVASLILGIASIVFLWGPFFGIGLAIAGVICAVMGMNQVKERPQEFTGHNLGQIGLVLSIIGGVLSLLVDAFVWTRVWWWR